MRILITGGSGQLGFDIFRKYSELHGQYHVWAPNSTELDITDKDKVVKQILQFQPDIIYHCAAYTQVDAAESNKEICYNVNVNGTKNLLEAAKIINATFVYISTDYVFDGEKQQDYLIKDKTHPLNYYGQTKLEGELCTQEYYKSFVVRTSWVFGTHGNNFLKKMLELSAQKESLSIINDQFGKPTYTYDLATALINLANTDNYGIYHITNSGSCSWYDFAKYFFALNNITIPVKAVSSNEYKTAAKRPKNSSLADSIILPTWQDAVYRFNLELQGE